MAIDPMARALIASFENEYTPADEGKVVANGALVSQTSTNINANGTYNTTLNNEVIVDVPNTYTVQDEGKVVSNGALVAQTSTSVTQNGTIDTTLNNEVVVNVSGNQLFKNVVMASAYAPDFIVTESDLSGVSAFRSFAFNNCQTLTEITLPSNITTFPVSCFANCHKLKDIVFPSKISSIANNVFQNCRAFEHLAINSQTAFTIGSSAFSGCTSLQDITIVGVSLVGINAFDGCTALTKVDLDGTFSSLGGYTFAGCTSLRTIIIRRTSLIPVAASTFTNVPADALIYVPDNLVDTYKANQSWADRASYIKPLSEYTPS